jgi:hypothetical protein
MKKYCCPQLGACQKATAGEIFEREPGADLKCPECGHILELHFSEATTTKSRKLGPPIAIGVVTTLLVVGAAGWVFFDGSSSDGLADQAAVVTAPTSDTTASLPATIAPAVGDTAQHKADGQAKLSVGDGPGAESSSAKAASNEMVKLGIAQMAQNKFDEAEKSFAASVSTDPKQSLGYYNMGILRLRQGRTEEALKQFEASFMVGFSHFDELDKDHDLEPIKKDPRFSELLKRYRVNENKTAPGAV